MKKFRFPLETALRIRERAVEEQKVQFRAVRAEFEACQQKIRDFEAEMLAEEAALRDARVTAQRLVEWDSYKGAAQRHRLRMEKQLAEIGVRLAERQKVLQKAERDLELVVRLKEKALKHWQKEYDKEQDALAEEAYLSRWATR